MSRTELGELTAELRAAIEAHRREGERRRFSTAPEDRERAEQAMCAAYAAAGLAPPEQFVWCANPVALQSRIDMLVAQDRAGDSVKGAVFDAALRRAGKQIDAGVPRSVRAAVWQLMADTPARASSRAVSEVVEIAARRPRSSVSARLKRWLARLRSGRRLGTASVWFGERMFSAHDHAPVAVYRCLHDACDLVAPTAHLAPIWEAVDTAGWIAPYGRVCGVSARHSVLAFDPQGRLHSPSGPALAFPDGWSLYAWKGVVVPDWMIKGERQITVEMIERQSDPVLRRCMIDIMTPQRFVGEAGAARVSADDTGVLWIKSWADWDRWAAVEVVNGTPEPDGTYKHYFLQVPPTVRSAREAVAWTYGMTEREYTQLSLRT